jgi:hypothetical protein
MSSMTSDRTSVQERSKPTREVGGWVIFAGVMMLVLGILDALWGLAAVINNEVVTVGGRGGVVIWDITAWGWAHLITGSIVAVTGLGLFAAQSWARWLGVFFVSLNLIAQFGTFSLFPLWSMTIIAIDIVIIYQLTVRWQDQVQVRG